MVPKIIQAKLDNGKVQTMRFLASCIVQFQNREMPKSGGWTVIQWGRYCDNPPAEMDGKPKA
jgi:hypothetical protein